MNSCQSYKSSINWSVVLDHVIIARAAENRSYCPSGDYYITIRRMKQDIQEIIISNDD